MEQVKTRHVEALDGLRALCALAVVAYHMGLRWMSGGLLGVTVLFVLSGYLATDSLLNEYAQSRGNIHLLEYYLRRLRRLMPQAIVCVIVTAALCTLFNRILLTKMRPDVIPALLMYLNWSKILTQVSYFAAAGGPSPLTHYWSLAIEWQFYLVWPLIMFVIMRMRVPKRGVRIALVLLALISAILMAVFYVPGEDPSRSYYGTDTRAMSLFAGCWLAFALPLRERSTADLAQGNRRLAVEGAAVGSLILLALLMIFTEGYTAFSYYGGVALVSVLAVVAIGSLLAEGTIVSRVLGLPPLVWLGKRSYALYLWHFPIVLLLSNSSATAKTPVWMYIVQLILSVGLAELSYRFIERPCGVQGTIPNHIRRFTDDIRVLGSADALRKRAAYLLPASAVGIIALVGLLVLPPAQAAGDNHADVGSEAVVSIGSEETTLVYDTVLIGDSVPLDAYDEIVAALPNSLVDCRISRQMSEGIEILSGYTTEGIVGNTVISCLGSNGVVTQSQLDTLLSLVGESRQLYIVNNRMPDDWEEANNTLFEEFAAAHDNVSIIDWYGASTGHDSWFWEDGTHPTPEGAAAYAHLIAEALSPQATSD